MHPIMKAALRLTNGGLRKASHCGVSVGGEAQGCEAYGPRHLAKRIACMTLLSGREGLLVEIRTREWAPLSAQPSCVQRMF